MAKLTVDKDLCIGCGLCVGTYDSAFTFDAEGKAEVIGEIDENTADEAIASCPAGAIAQ